MYPDLADFASHENRTKKEPKGIQKEKTLKVIPRVKRELDRGTAKVKIRSTHCRFPVKGPFVEKKEKAIKIRGFFRRLK